MLPLLSMPVAFGEGKEETRLIFHLGTTWVPSSQQLWINADNHKNLAQARSVMIIQSWGFESTTLREMDCFLLFMKFLPERNKYILIPNATQEPCSKSQMKESPQVPQEKVWYHASVLKQSRFWKQCYRTYFRTITFLLLALVFLSCSQENPYEHTCMHRSGEKSEVWDVLVSV